MIRNIITGLILLQILLVFGCVPAKPSFEKKIMPADRLLKKIEANRRKVKTFYGSGYLYIKTDELDARTRFQISLKKPDSIKISLYGPFGIDVAQALVTKNNFTFFDMMNDQVITGDTRGDVLKKIFKIDLNFNDLLDAFTGAVNLTERLTKNPDKFEIGEDNYYLSYSEANNLIHQYLIGINDNALINYKIIANNKNTDLEAKYSEFREFEEIPIPYKIFLINELKNQKVEIEYKSIKINTNDLDMSIVIPEDVEVIQWR